MKIKILSTSDVHGYVYPTNFSNRENVSPFGMLKAGAVIKDAKQDEQKDEIVIGLENGDWIQGSPLTAYLASVAESESPNLTKITSNVGYDAATLGNHEFNFGLKYIRNAESKRNYPILNANIDGAMEQQIADKPYTIIKKKGIKIAILGLTTTFIPNWEQPANMKGLTFNSALETAKKYVPELRKKADVVIVSYHGGIEADPATGKPTEKYTVENEGFRILQEVPGIDALVTGHQHRRLADKINGIPFTQPGVHGTDVGEIELNLDKDKQIVASSSKLISTKNTNPDYSLIPDKNLEKHVEDWLEQPIGKITGASMKISDSMQARLKNHPYLDLINRVQMDALDVDISGTALFNDDIAGYQDNVTMRDIINAYPYANTAVAEEITGADLKEALEKCAGFFELKDKQITVNPKYLYPKYQLFNYDVYSGIDYDFDISLPIGHRLTKLIYHGEPITDNQKLKVAVNNYRAVGGGEYKMFSSDKIIEQTPDSLPDLLINYLKSHSPYHAVEPNNLKIIH